MIVGQYNAASVAEMRRAVEAERARVAAVIADADPDLFSVVSVDDMRRHAAALEEAAQLLARADADRRLAFTRRAWRAIGAALAHSKGD